MDRDMVMLECEELMDNAIAYLKNELRGVRTGRASAGLIEYVKIEAYGSMTDLKNLAGIASPEPTQIVVKPFDPGTISDIVKGIERADLGLNPQSDGKMIRIPVPSLSGDRRRQLATQTKTMGENAKVTVRNARRDANKHLDQLEKDKTNSVSEDEAKGLKTDVQDLTKKHETTIDKLVTAKADEIMQI